ncbi:MAG: ASCH domain-containing protein [bacterium]|nr:ASCH domain-containing protein [bacterium]
MRKHLAIMHKSALEAILSGKKTVETRFSKHKISPFGVINARDLVFMKPPGGEIVGQFRVKKVFSFEGLTPKDIEKIFSDYGKEISVGDKLEDEAYEKLKQGSFYGTLIFISESERLITSPIKIKKSDLRGWMVIE